MECIFFMTNMVRYEERRDHCILGFPRVGCDEKNNSVYLSDILYEYNKS